MSDEALIYTKKIVCRFDDETQEQIKEIMRVYCLTSSAEAIRWLVEIGIEEVHKEMKEENT